MITSPAGLGQIESLTPENINEDAHQRFGEARSWDLDLWSEVWQRESDVSHPNDTAPMPEADFRGVSLLFDELENELVVH